LKCGALFSESDKRVRYFLVGRPRPPCIHHRRGSISKPRLRGVDYRGTCVLLGLQSRICLRLAGALLYFLDRLPSMNFCEGLNDLSVR
jgi:hypothetical protein